MSSGGDKDLRRSIHDGPDIHYIISDCPRSSRGQKNGCAPKKGCSRFLYGVSGFYFEYAL